jgi:hypothetical protein
MVLIDVFGRDTNETILRRVASQLNSIPKYIYLNTPLNLVDAKRRGNVDVDVIDILSHIKRDSNFQLFYSENMKKMIKEKKLGLVDDILKPWAYFNIDTLNIPDEFIMTVILGSMGNVADNMSFSNFNKEKDAFLKELKTLIKNNRELNDEFVSTLQKDVNIQGKEFTEFELEKINYLLELNSRYLTIYEIFDNIVLNSTVPFASLNKYYKIFKEYTPNLNEQFDAIDNYILLKVIVQDQEPIDVYFYIEDDKLKITFFLEISKKINRGKFISDILEIIKSIDPVIENQQEIGVNGVFYIPNQSLSTYVFAHLVLNDLRFSSKLVIDESVKATKTKEGIYTYYNSGEEIISTVITSKIVNRYDPAVRYKDEVLFPEKSNYLSIKISRAKSSASVQEFQQSISKLITLYNEDYQKIVDFYRIFIPNFNQVEEVKKPEASKKIFFKDIEPKVFSKSYTRTCANKPDMIQASEAYKYKDIIIFPKDPPTSTEDAEQRYYTCENRQDDFKYVGLRENNEGGMKYKYVPCCYVNAQQDKKAFKSYYLGEDVEDDTSQQKFIKTNKFVNYDIYGLLTSYTNISRLFESVNKDSSIHYIRRGVDRSFLSFVQCIYEATNTPYIGENRLENIKNTIKSISSNEALLSCARQSFPNSSINEIQTELLKENTYLDPRLWCDVMETYFNCKIYILSKSQLELPKHVKNYLCSSNKTKKSVVIVFEHMGSESDKAVYPQCELVVRAYKKVRKNVDMIFPYDDIVSQNLMDIFNKLKKSYYLGNEVLDYTIEPEFKILGQKINAYGKTNALIIRLEKLKPLILFSKIPIPPLNVIETSQHNITELKNVVPIFRKIHYLQKLKK